MAKAIFLLSLVALTTSQRFDVLPSWRRPVYSVAFTTTASIVTDAPPATPAPPASPASIELAPVPAMMVKTLPIPVVSQRSGACDRKNARYPVTGQCDAYVECRNFEAREMLCPEGLRFNPEAPWNIYPCGYPSDVPCRERAGLQPSQPTNECLHQFGYFRAGDSLNCGAYRQCVAGRAFDKQCSLGLAWNSASNKCDWPDQVPECDVEGFLGFRCPAVSLDDNGIPIDRQSYRHPSNCTLFFNCVNDKPRLLACDRGYAFDEVSARCQDAEEVPACRRQ